MALISESPVQELSSLLLGSSCRAGKAYMDEEKERISKEIKGKLTSQHLEIALAAFPFKIPNPLKTYSPRPDWGERIAIERLIGISKAATETDIDLRWNIITDGMFYADELHVEKERVVCYQEGIRTIAQTLGFKGTFTELDDLVEHKIIHAVPLDLDDPASEQYVLRTAGMMDTISQAALLEDMYMTGGSVACAVEKLLRTDPLFRKEAEASAAIYQARKRQVEDAEIFTRCFPNAVRASIQPDANRNLQDSRITRPLSIRITEKNGQNLFPWLGMGTTNGSTWHNAYVADLKREGKRPEERDGLIYFTS
jgi:hypothetical protein